MSIERLAKMSVRRVPVSNTSPAPRFTLNNNALRDGVARSLGSRVALSCKMNEDIKSLSHADNNLIHALNEPYRAVYPGQYPNPAVQKHVNSIEYKTNAYMEHNLSMKLTSQGHGGDTTMTFMVTANPNLIQDQDTGISEMPSALPVVHEIYRRSDAGCYKRLFRAAYDIEQDWKYHPTSQKEMETDFMSGAPYFSAIGMGLEAMLDASANDFTGTQAMNAGNQVPLYNQMRFLVTHYATAVEAFNSDKQLGVLHERARHYQMAQQMAQQM